MLQGLNSRLQRIITWLLYSAAYVCFFVIFAYATFPYERLKQRIIAGYNASQVGKVEPRRMEVGELTWSWRFPGVVLSDVSLIGPKSAVKPKPAKGEKEAEQRSIISVEEVYAGVSLWSALTGAADVAFHIRGFGGSMEGSFTQSEEGLTLGIDFQDVAPNQLPGVAEALQLPMQGRLTGNIALQVPEGKYSLAEGVVDVQIVDLQVGDGKTKVRDLFALPTVEVGELEVVAEVKAGKVEVSKFKAGGQDLDVELDGKLRLRDDLAQSRIEQMNLAFKFSDKYRDKDDTTRSLLGKPGDKLGGLIDMDPKVKQAKKPDGYYRWRLAGLISRPNFQPGRTTPVRQAKGARGRATSPRSGNK